MLSETGVHNNNATINYKIFDYWDVPDESALAWGIKCLLKEPATTLREPATMLKKRAETLPEIAGWY
ncbi:MAG: hypothetical protein ABIX01_22790 [Chitinophagaceae bacterium]